MALEPLSVGAQDLRGLFDTSYGLTSSTATTGTQTEQSTNRQSLDLNWNRVVSPALRYRVTLRGERNDTSVTSGDTSFDSNTVLVQPQADFTLTWPVYSLNAGLRLREQFSESSTDTSSQDLQLSDRTYFLRFFYTPQDLPSASFVLDRTTSVDDRKTRDTEQTRYQASTQYTLKDVSGSYAFSRFVDENNIDRRTRTQDTHLGTLGYSTVLLSERLTLQANVSGSRSTTTEEFFARGTTVVNLGLVRGLTAGVDLTPETSSPCPPLPCPADAVVTAPGLSTGAGSVPLSPFVSVGFELPAPQGVGEIGLTVAPVPPFTLPDNLGSFLTFRVFSTNDTTLVAWTEVTGVSQAYDAAQSRFTLSFPGTTARFFKAYVSRNDFGAQVVATGISAGNAVDVNVGSERVTKSLSGSLSGGVTFIPLKWLTASYNLSLNGSRQEPEYITSWSGTHAGNVTVQAHRLLTVSGSAQYTFNESDQPGFLPSTTSSYSLTLGSVPLPTFSTALTLGRAENRLDDELQSRNDAASLTASAKVFPRLTGDSTLSIGRGEDFVAGTETFTQGMALNLNARVLPRINAVLNYAVQRQEVSPAPAGQEPVTTTHAIGGGATYTLSRVVNFTTRFDYNLAPGGTTFSQTYKVDWIPTQKVSTFVSYQRTTQETHDTEGSLDSVSGNVRWSLSRYLDLSANASYARTATGSIVSDVKAFNVSAGLRF